VKKEFGVCITDSWYIGEFEYLVVLILCVARIIWLIGDLIIGVCELE
jgi:hypothetical protein